MAPCRLALRLRSAARDGTRTTASCREEAIHQSAQSPQEVRKTSEDGRLHPSVANDITAGQPQNWTLGRRSANQPDGPPEAGAQVRILPGAPRTGRRLPARIGARPGRRRELRATLGNG